jgi:hypothetical protein
MMTRRQFSKVSFVSLIIGAAVSVSGCLFSTVEADIAAYVPIALQAVAGVLAIFDPGVAAIFTPLVTLINAGLASVQKAIADWQAADATQKPGLVGGITAALQVVESDFQNFLTSVDVNAPGVSTAVNSLVSIILGVLLAFQNKLGGAPVSAAHTMTVRAKTLQIEPLKLSPKQFKAAFNQRAESLGHKECCIR